MEENVQNPEVPVRYSDEELEEFRQIILAKIAEAKKSLEFYVEATGNSNEELDTSPTFKYLEERKRRRDGYRLPRCRIGREIRRSDER